MHSIVAKVDVFPSQDVFAGVQPHDFRGPQVRPAGQRNKDGEFRPFFLLVGQSSCRGSKLKARRMATAHGFEP